MTEPSRSAARRIAAAFMISLTGTQAALTALFFVLFDRTGSSRWVAAGLLLTIGARGVIMPLGSALGDRFDRRKVMIASDLCGVAAFLALAMVRDPGLLLAIAFVGAAVETPFFPAATAAIPNLVPDGDLAWANGTVGMGESLGYLVGPMVGGLLVAAVGARMVFVLDAASFAASAAIVATVHGRFAGDRSDADAHRGLRAGFAWIRRNPLLGPMTLGFVAFAIGVGSVLVAELPLTRAFGGGAAAYGFLASGFGIGALGGAVWARRRPDDGQWPVLVVGSFVTATALAAVVFAPALWFVFLAMLAAGTSDGAVDVAVQVVFQRASPDAVRSRVMGALEAIFLTGLAVSFVFGGPVVDTFGPKAAYLLGGIGCGVQACVLLVVDRRRRRAEAVAAAGTVTVHVNTVTVRSTP